MKKQFYVPIFVSALALLMCACTGSPPVEASSTSDMPIEAQPVGSAPAGMGGFRARGPLVMRQDVQVELGLSEGQIAEIEGLLDESEDQEPTGGESAWEDVLTDDQRARYRELSLQRAGLRALAEDDVAEELGLSPEQAATIQEAIEAARPQRGEGGFDREAFMRLREEMNEKIMDVLTDEQKAKWEEMLGDEFEFQRQQRGTSASGNMTPR